MGSKDKYYGLHAAAHGFDDIGATSAPTGSILGMTSATPEGPLFAGKLKITVSTASWDDIKKGQPINLSSTFQPTGPTRVLKKVGTNQLVVNLAFNSGSAGTGTFATDGGQSAWDGFMPVGADATNVNMTFWNPNEQGGNEQALTYTKDQKYFFPGTIKTVLLTSGNIRLFRAASLRPKGANAV